MNEKELAELTDATVKAIKAEVGLAYISRLDSIEPTLISWDLIWTLVGNALAEASRRGAAA